MTVNEYKRSLTPELINSIFHGSLIDSASSKWYITMDGKIISVGGKVFFDSRTQASKAFYNYFKWRANWRIYSVLGEEGPSWRNDNNRVTNKWKALKEVLQEQHHFKIQQYGGQ